MLQLLLRLEKAPAQLWCYVKDCCSFAYSARSHSLVSYVAQLSVTVVTGT